MSIADTFMEMEGGMVASGSGVGGRGAMLNEHGIPVCKMKRALEMDHGDKYNSIKALTATQSIHLKMDTF